MAKDEISIHIDADKPLPEILDYQVEFCPKCSTRIEDSFGLAGGGFGAYGYCPQCEVVVWKVVCEE